MSLLDCTFFISYSSGKTLIRMNMRNSTMKYWLLTSIRVKGSTIRKSKLIHFRNLVLKNSHNKNKTKDRIVTNQTRFLSLPKPNGIGPIKPPTATFALEVDSLEPFNNPKNTAINPIIINKNPSLINCSILNDIRWLCAN